MHFTTVFALLVLPVFVAATPNPKPWATPTVTITETATSTPVSECSTGSLQCCDSMESASDPSILALLGLLGIVESVVDSLVGLSCNSITDTGATGGSCSANVVCCEDNSEGGLISIGCEPVIL